MKNRQYVEWQIIKKIVEETVVMLNSIEQQRHLTCMEKEHITSALLSNSRGRLLSSLILTPKDKS